MPAKSAGSLATVRWVCAVISPFQTCQPLPDLATDAPDLDDVMHVASGNLVLPNLYLGLQARGLLNQLPAEFSETLEGFKCLNTLRNARLRNQMLELSTALNAVGVWPIWLKGANHLLETDWQNSGRMMLDLDVWLPDPAQRAAAVVCLTQLGYVVPGEYLESDFEASQHLAPRFRAGEVARIELHRSIVSPAVAQLLPDREALARVEWIAWEGQRVGRLSLPDRLRHSYIQCTEMSGNAMFRAQIPLMKVLDCVQLAQACGDVFGSKAFVGQLEQLPWRLRSRQFLSYLERDFGLASPLAPDGSYILRRKLARQFPKLMYGRLFLQRAYLAVCEGRVGSPRLWWPRLACFLSNY